MLSKKSKNVQTHSSNPPQLRPRISINHKTSILLSKYSGVMYEGEHN